MLRKNWAALDGLRGLSIIFVILIHIWAHSNWESTGIPIKLSISDVELDLTWIFATGHNAVIIFFVLSGFLLYRHWLEQGSELGKNERLKKFYAKRLRRIAPAFVYFTVIYLLLAFLLGKHHFGADLYFSNLILNATFLAPLISLIETAKPLATSLDIIPGTWSLNPEIWFYFLMPFLAILLERTKYSWVFLLALSLVGPFFREFISPQSSFLIKLALPGVLDAFLLGMAAASFSMQVKNRNIFRHLFPIGLFLYIYICVFSPVLIFDARFQLGIASMLMVVGLVSSDEPVWCLLLSRPWLTYIGNISFSMFLCNILVIWYIVLPFAQALGIQSSAKIFALNLFLGFPLILIISHYSYKFIEYPFLSRKYDHPLFLVRNIFYISSIIFLAAIVPACFAYFVNDGLRVEYKGPAIRTVVAMVPSEFVKPDNFYIPFTGKFSLDSETKSAAINLVQTANNAVSINASGASIMDKWVSVNVPINENLLLRDRPVFMTATLSVVKSSKGEACLGIFNGEADVCSKRVSLDSTVDLSTETFISKSGLLQFKLNIFPNSNDGVFKIEFKNVKIYQKSVKTMSPGN